MQDQLKERLTGAAILVVVVVLAVPEMFRGRPGGAPAEAPDASAVPLRTVTVVDAAPATAPAPAPGGAQSADQPAGPSTGPQSASPPDAPSAPASPASVGAVGPAGSTKPATVTPGTAQAPPLPQPIPQPIPKPQAANAPASPPAAVPGPAAVATLPAAATQHERAADRAGGAGWVVQVGSFRVRSLAERMARETHAKGFKVRVVGPDPKGLYRVRSGVLADREAALALKQQMMAHGLKPIVNSSP